MKNTEITVEITENENGQLAKDLEQIIAEDNCSVSKTRQTKTNFSNN